MIFIDTGAFLARYLSRDQHHRRANDYWNQLIKSREPCYTSNFVLDETLTLLGRRAGYGFAAQRAKAVYASQLIRVLRPVREDEKNAIAVFEKYADQQMSYTDCISCVLMQKTKIKRTFSFDHHFRIAGFQVLPENE